MYVVLQGMGSLPCQRVYIIYIMSEVLKLQRFNKKQVPRNDQYLFILYLKNEFFKLTEGYTPRPVSYTHSFNAKRVFACILFCSYPCFSFSFDACACVGTMIALNLAIVIQNLPKTPKNVQSAGFHTCFRYGNIVIPMVFALALFMHSKILPQIFLPQIF